MMCVGVVDAVAIEKFSTSPSKFGPSEISVAIAAAKATMGVRSFTTMYGKNFILSLSAVTPSGLDDPV